LSKSRFDHLSAFIRKRYRWIIAAWVIVAILSLFMIPKFFSSVSYNIVGSLGGPSNSESQKASSILSTEFPTANESGLNTILVVLQNADVYSNLVKSRVLSLNGTLTGDAKVSGYTGQSSMYTLEYGILTSSAPSLVPQVADLEANISYMNTGLHALEQNLSTLSESLFQLQQGMNQTSQLVYGVPATFVQVWQGVMAQLQAENISNPYIANAQANSTVLALTGNFGGNAQSLGYYTLFFQVWNSTFQALPSTTSPLDRETLAVNESVTTFLSSGQIDAQTAQMVTTVAEGLNVNDWNQNEAISQLTISTLASNVPSQLTSSLGVSPTSLISALYQMGPSPATATLINYTITLSESSFAETFNQSIGFPVSQLLQAAYALGPSPTLSQMWNLASAYVAQGTTAAFSGSPLFSVNSTSLADFLSTLPQNASTSDLGNAAVNVVSSQPFNDYPYLPSSSILQNFVSQDNKSMLIVLDFSSTPDRDTITQVKTDVNDSGLQSLGTVYVTGASVVTSDVEGVFAPALTLTVGPGIIMAIIIVGLLFLSPVAALIPVLMGGISAEISLAAIYLATVEVGHGNITFLTPTITILLMLGLSVDYAVLQLRRTREERRAGKSVQDSVAVSIRWAGQAVLTAGVTVIVAYIVMALANVPIFSSVATSIALGVSILLAISLTLVPSLEIALGDKAFWPSHRQSQIKSGQSKNRLIKLAQNVLKRKVPIVIVISLIALGAFYVEYRTPTGLDFLKLIPNFQSNQGLTAVTQSFGSGRISPVQIVVTTPTGIIYGNNEFNQTLLNQLELISNAAANSEGVASVTGPTRPYGSLFNYSSIGNMSQPLMLQYEQGMLTLIGNDNKTALINVGLSNPSESPQAVSSLLDLQKNINQVTLLNGVTVNYGGSTQSISDNQSFIAGLLPEVVAILSAAVYVILFLQLRSAFTPLRLIFTILCSVVMSLALLSVVFYMWLNLPILDFAPLFVVVTMLGVGIDYDIFFVTRIREETLKGQSDDDAIKTAIDRVWITILGLGFVLATVFASLLITGIAILQEISLTVSAAILIDVLIVIPLFVPALMGLAQSFNWWPSRINRNQKQQETPQTQSARAPKTQR
jgi:RND superfamily putative drug exporter